MLPRRKCACRQYTAWWVMTSAAATQVPGGQGGSGAGAGACEKLARGSGSVCAPPPPPVLRRWRPSEAPPQTDAQWVPGRWPPPPPRLAPPQSLLPPAAPQRREQRQFMVTTRSSCPLQAACTGGHGGAQGQPGAVSSAECRGWYWRKRAPAGVGGWHSTAFGGSGTMRPGCVFPACLVSGGLLCCSAGTEESPHRRQGCRRSRGSGARGSWPGRLPLGRRFGLWRRCRRL